MLINESAASQCYLFWLLSWRPLSLCIWGESPQLTLDRALVYFLLYLQCLARCWDAVDAQEMLKNARLLERWMGKLTGDASWNGKKGQGGPAITAPSHWLNHKAGLRSGRHIQSHQVLQASRTFPTGFPTRSLFVVVSDPAHFSSSREEHLPICWIPTSFFFLLFSFLFKFLFCFGFGWQCLCLLITAIVSWIFLVCWVFLFN